MDTGLKPVHAVVFQEIIRDTATSGEEAVGHLSVAPFKEAGICGANRMRRLGFGAKSW